MAGYPPDSLVMVRPFTHRRDGETVTIADTERQVFLAIPAEGLDILQSLTDGNTVAETVRRYEERYDETPDIDDFLDAMRAEGFIVDAPRSGDAAEEHHHQHARYTWDMDRLRPEVARKLLSAPVLIVLGLVCVVGFVVQFADPKTIPTPTALLFPVHFAALTWATLFCALIGVALHELAHVVAARAAGVPARIGIGNQLYVLVAQTDMTGIWMASKRHRYLAFMIGSLVDLASYSILITVLWAGRHTSFHLPRDADLLISAILLTYGTRVVWQWFVFLRTDGYYVVATALNCKSLLTDTEDYLYNKMAALRRVPQRVDQSDIPAREMRIVRVFAWVWVIGRFFAIGTFAVAGLPLLWGYLYQVILLVTGQHSAFGSFDAVTVVLVGFAIDGGGLVMWLRSMYRRGRERRRARRAVAHLVVADLGMARAAVSVAGAREPGLS